MIFVGFKMTGAIYNLSIIYLIILIQLFTFTKAEDEWATNGLCQRRPFVHKIRKEGCVAKSIVSYVCYGHCRSYARPSFLDYRKTTRICACCQPSEIGEIGVALYCPDVTNQRKKSVLKYRYPSGCSCRPCSFIGNILPQEFADFQSDHKLWMTK